MSHTLCQEGTLFCPINLECWKIHMRCPQEVAITVSIVRWAPALSVVLRQGIRKVPFPRKRHIQAQRRKKYSVRSTTLSPPGCLSSNLSGRREGSVLPFFFVDVHLRWAEHHEYFDVLWYSRSGSGRKATNCLLDERVYMSFRHATGFQVYGLSPHHTAAPESRQASRSTWIASRCRGDHHLIGYRWLWWLYS